MALDRESIARRDFPTHRRGYDPAAVDAHLAQVAEEVAELRRRSLDAAPLSARAGEQVEAIVAAAERSASEIRDGARAQARDHVARVAAAADGLRQRIAEVGHEVERLLGDLRASAERLRGELAALHDGAAELARVGGEPEPASRAPEPAAGGDDPTAAARIVALDMALAGTPREETDRFLAEHYELADRASLLDEAYAAASA